MSMLNPIQQRALNARAIHHHIQGITFCAKGWLRGFWQEFDYLIIGLGILGFFAFIACLVTLIS